MSEKETEKEEKKEVKEHKKDDKIVFEFNSKKLKEKTEKLLKDPFNLAILAIMLYATIVRIYFFNIAKNQAHWWDSLGFGSIAKEWVYHLWTDNAFLQSEMIIRPPLLSLVWSFFIRLNISEVFSLLFIEILPSILSIYFIFLLAKEMYGKRIALISAIIFSSIWIHLFYSVRIMSDVPALFFTIVSMYFFVKSYRDFNIKYFSIAIFFISLAIITRYFFGIIGAIYIIMVIINHKHKFISNKNFWIGGLIGAIPIILFFIFNLIVYSSLLPASSVYTKSAIEKPNFAYYVLGFINYDIGLLLTLFFGIGLLFVIYELIIGFDALNKIHKLRNHLLLFLILASSLIFFIFFLRAAEDRYLFLCMPSLIILSSIGIDLAYSFLKEYQKEFAVVFIIILLLFTSYNHIKYANTMIVGKVSSYSQMKDAFLWINQNTPQNSKITGDGIILYNIYYANRPFYDYNISLPDSLLNADFVVLHGFEHQSPELINLVNSNQTLFIPIHATYFDQANQQPAVVIYQINKNVL